MSINTLHKGDDDDDDDNNNNSREIYYNISLMVLQTSEEYNHFLQNSVIHAAIFTFYVDTSKNDSDIF